MNIESVNHRVYYTSIDWMKSNQIVLLDEILSRDVLDNEMMTKRYVIIKGKKLNGDGIKLIVVCSTNCFNVKKDVEIVMKIIDTESKEETIIISKTVYASFNENKFIRNVPHSWFFMDPRKHVNVAKHTIISVENAKWDNFITNVEKLKNIPHIRFDTEPVLFWIGAKRGDFILCESSAEETVSTCDYKLVV